jgi:hypothetical protein
LHSFTVLLFYRIICSFSKSYARGFASVNIDLAHAAAYSKRRVGTVVELALFRNPAVSTVSDLDTARAAF